MWGPNGHQHWSDCATLFFCAWFQGKEFREWLLKKLIQGEQACHRATDFAKLHVSVSSNGFVYIVLGGMLYWSILVGA